ncbi:ammonium transporter [Corynebacterium sp. 13CS0277]|uniref:ammonium transporter n=1 Tax=Corynebacterium sp. 13CS0277 TaxID=2071994 RepID=UPI000D0319E4|nr:ammonium transporter [Corynebacterium sp. 13CS0277]PRQ12542.1 ammonium transporter [Corynebacterium sp. 13CS0277]
MSLVPPPLGAAADAAHIPVTTLLAGAAHPQPAVGESTATGGLWVLVAASLVLLMTPALALFYGGMSRQKSVLNMMMMSFGAMGVVTVTSIAYGYSMSYGPTSLAGVIASPLDYLGLRGVITASDHGTPVFAVGDNGYARIIDVCFQLTFAIISVALISGAIAERVKYSAWLLFSACWVTLVYYPLAHQVWGGGILGEDAHGVSAWLFGTAGEHARIAPIDFAGGTVVHISAGTAALVLVLIIGNRRGFPHHVHRPHNLPLVMLGAALLWFGWLGFNAGSALGDQSLAGLAWLNTTAAAAAGLLGWLCVERIRDGHATSLGAASGVVAGLVTITPAAGDVMPLWALLLGVTGGALAAMGVGLKYRFGFDDTLDVVGVHLVGAVWGTVAVGFCATGRGLLTGGGLRGGCELLVVQALIALAAMALAGVVTAVLGLTIRRTMGWRVDRDVELGGIDTHIHGESAYDTTVPTLGRGR